MLPWFYSLDHYNYARWLSVHFYNMNMLPHTNPNVNDAFINEGNFVISRTPDAFSAMGIEQCHEQLNELVKGEGGAIGLTEDEDRQKVVCRPEVARIVMKFEENSVLKQTRKTEYKHHEEIVAFQKRFKTHVDCLVSEIKKFGNPFIVNDEECELVQLDTRDVVGPNIVKSINEIKRVGKEQVDQFVKERLVTKAKDIDAPIKKNKLSLFSSGNTISSQNSSKNEKKELKRDRKLFAQLFITAQVRGGDVQELFQHETRREPPSLSKEGEIRSGNKTDLLPCLKMTESFQLQNQPVNQLS